MKFGILFKEENKKAKELVKRVTAYLGSKRQQVLTGKDFKQADYIITLGGDGTLIHSACEYAQLGLPFVGINTGRLGFLTAVEVGDWQAAIDRLIQNKVFISERITLEATLESSGQGPEIGKDKLKTGNWQPATTYRAVNEVVARGLYRVVNLAIDVAGEKFLNVIGDGVIVATQTGSTAYSLSAGGPILDPNLDSLLVTPINPIGLPIPSVVLSPNAEILIKVVGGDDISLVLDGQEHTRLKVGNEVEVKRGKFKVKFGYLEKNHFTKSLNSKFGLGTRGF